MRFAVIGAGSMGSKHARVLSRIALETDLDVELAYVVDIDHGRAEDVAKAYGAVPALSIDSIGEIDGAIVATPTPTHYEIVSKLVERGVGFILVEKPMTLTLSEAVGLVEKVEDYGVALGVGFVERFNPVLTALFRERDRGLFNTIVSAFSLRIGPFTGRAGDVDVNLELGSHDIDIHTLLIGKLPLRVRAFGLSRVVSDKIDHVWINMNYGDAAVMIEVSRLFPVKLRLALIDTGSSLVSINFIEQELGLINGGRRVSISVRREEPLFLEDLLSIIYYQKYRKALVDAYQGFVVQYICDVVSKSYGEKIDVSLSEDSVTATYRDFFNKGLEGFRGFWSSFMSVYSLASR